MRSYQKHSLETLQQAITASSSDLMSSVEAAKLYDVPESIIRNRKHRPLTNIASDRSFLFKKTDEEHLAQLLLDLEKTGFLLTKQKVLKIVEEFLETLQGKARRFLSS